jgi:hypothetical protein
VGLLRNPIHVTLNEVKGLLTLVESTSRRFFAALRITRGGFFNSPSVTSILPACGCPVRLRALGAVDKSG